MPEKKKRDPRVRILEVLYDNRNEKSIRKHTQTYIVKESKLIRHTFSTNVAFLIGKGWAWTERVGSMKFYRITESGIYAYKRLGKGELELEEI